MAKSVQDVLNIIKEKAPNVYNPLPDTKSSIILNFSEPTLYLSARYV